MQPGFGRPGCGTNALPNTPDAGWNIPPDGLPQQRGHLGQLRADRGQRYPPAARRLNSVGLAHVPVCQRHAGGSLRYYSVGLAQTRLRFPHARQPKPARCFSELNGIFTAFTRQVCLPAGLTYVRIATLRRDGRAAKGACLENRYGETHRGFESHSFRSG